MTAAWFVASAAGPGLVLRATLLIGVAWAAAAALRKANASAATRHMVWLLGVAALLALPLLWWLAPPLRLPILRPEAASLAAALAPPASTAPPTTPDWAGWSAALLLFYALGATVLLLRFAICRGLVSRLWRDAEPARDPAWQGLLYRVSRQMRLSRPVELRIARGPAMPMTWGTLAPKVLLPAEASAWPPERRRLVLLHELAHVARHDSLSRSAASLTCALYWFHPGAWFAARQMRMEQEYAADDRVLAAGEGARTYALSLLYLASRVEEGSRPDHAAAMAGMCHLERRLVSITASVHRERPGPGFLSASAAIAASVTLAVAAGVPVRPLSAMSEPIPMAPAFLATPAASIPAEDRAGPERRMPNGASIVPQRQGRPREARDGYEAPRAAAPRLQAEVRSQEAFEGQTGPAVQGFEVAPSRVQLIDPDERETPAPARQRLVYGPSLPQPIAAEQSSDPRIPQELRRRPGRGAGTGPRYHPAMPIAVAMLRLAVGALP